MRRYAMAGLVLGGLTFLAGGEEAAVFAKSLAGQSLTSAPVDGISAAQKKAKKAKKSRGSGGSQAPGGTGGGGSRGSFTRPTVTPPGDVPSNKPRP